MEVADIVISHPDKPLYQKAELTKADVVHYYARISKYILPWLKNRPLTLQRFPDGVDEEGFYQKRAKDYFPDFIKRVEVKTNAGSIYQPICNSKRALIYLVNQGCVSFHVWLSHCDRLDYPDRAVVDIDPSQRDIRELRRAAKLVKAHFSNGSVSPCLMTTGKSGLHVYWQVTRRQKFDAVRADIKAKAEQLAEQYPDLFTTAMRKNERKGRIFLDYLRNAYGQTCICPYSLRANDRAGIAAPLDWSELGKLERSDRYTPSNIFRRMAQKKHDR